MDTENNTIITDNAVGTDPTLVEVIDSLDIVPEEQEESNNNPKGKKKKNKSKKKLSKKSIIITVITFVLIFGVGFGLFFYLGIGTGRTKTKKANFKIQNKVITAGEKLPLDVTAYGDFNKVDITTCTIDGINTIDTNNPGTYDYSITCGGKKLSSKIIINPRVVYATKMVTKKVGDSYSISDFITGADDYKYSFDASKIEEALANANSFITVPITIEANDKTIEVYSLLYVLPEEPNFILTCRNPDTTKYTTYDMISFNSAHNSLKDEMRYYEITYKTVDDMIIAVNSITNGEFTNSDISGKAIVDLYSNKITIVQKLTSEILDSEYEGTFPSSFDDIDSYYMFHKDYNCVF